MKLSRSLMKAKCIAAAIHIGISLLIFAAIVAWMLISLYPSFYFNMSGGVQGLLLMFGVDVVLGPLITFLVFNPHKKRKEIISDLLIIAVIQFSALGYGFRTVYHERPWLTVVYDMGSSVVLNAREVAEDEVLSKVDMSKLSRLEGVAIASMGMKDGQQVYLNIHQTPDMFVKADQIARRSLRDSQEQAQLMVIEKQHGKVFVLSVIGKYTGAYIILDKNLNYLTKIGEKPTA
jgi:fimbrial assembly protein, serogroup I